MIKFIDIETGNAYNGHIPYVHWFPGQQSTDLIYTYKICFITSTSHTALSLDSNVFKLIDTDKLSGQIINYSDIICNEVVVRGIQIDDTETYIYMIHISAQSENPGEYTTDIKIKDLIGGEWDIRVGADFYAENESLYINLSNFGVELPSAIQNTIYDVDVKEKFRDNITMNRKLKELLSNYWDVIANKGNYKSLINSLKWFEWNDLIKLKEIWKHQEFGDTVYDMREICSLLEDKYNDTYNGFSKTTYLSLYTALHQITSKWDEEQNPVLENIVFKWGREDLMLKMCLLGNFYETYFMPIHLDLIHATIENIVFTNTIKVEKGSNICRNDYIYQINSISCNIKDGQNFTLGEVCCQVGPHTRFGSKWNRESSYSDINIMGVDEIAEFEYVTTKQPINDNDLKTFYSQLYNGMGVIIDFDTKIELDEMDYIIESKLWVNDKQVIDNSIIKDDNIKFKLLLQTEGSYNISIQYRTAGSRIYCKVLNVNVLNLPQMTLNLYKVKHRLYNIEFGRSINDYITGRCKTQDGYIPIIQYICPSTSQTDGIALNNILILKGDYSNNSILNNHYYISKKVVNDKLTYTTCISKKYWMNPQHLSIYKQIVHDIYRNDYGYFPEFHYLIPLDGDKESDYIISNTDTIAVIPELPIGLDIDEVDWKFINVSTGKVFKLPYIKEPYVAPNNPQVLEPGYYDIIFRFKVGSEWHEMKIDSAFRMI